MIFNLGGPAPGNPVFSASSGSVPFTDEGGGKFTITLRSDASFTVDRAALVDVYVRGGGGGGAGGYAQTVKRVLLTPGVTYKATVGKGGTCQQTTNGAWGAGTQGGTSKLVGGSTTIASASGGGGGRRSPKGWSSGGNGASGGGAGANITGTSLEAAHPAGNGGSHGTSGTGYADPYGSPGVGNGTSGYAFGDANFGDKKKHGAGGGGGSATNGKRDHAPTTFAPGMGGADGGGKGGDSGAGGNATGVGCGGGGGSSMRDVDGNQWMDTATFKGGNGSAGAVILRSAR